MSIHIRVALLAVPWLPPQTSSCCCGCRLPGGDALCMSAGWRAPGYTKLLSLVTTLSVHVGCRPPPSPPSPPPPPGPTLSVSAYPPSLHNAYICLHVRFDISPPPPGLDPVGEAYLLPLRSLGVRITRGIPPWVPWGDLAGAVRCISWTGDDTPCPSEE